MSSINLQKNLAALGSLAALGAIMGLRLDWISAGSLALQMPLNILMVVLMTAPALYIGAAFIGIAPPAAKMFLGMGSSLRDGGLLLLGLIPPLLFLNSTTVFPSTGMLLGVMTLAMVALLTLALLYRRLFQEGKGIRALLFFGLWSMATLGIGLRMIFKLMP